MRFSHRTILFFPHSLPRQKDEPSGASLPLLCRRRATCVRVCVDCTCTHTRANTPQPNARVDTHPQWTGSPPNSKPRKARSRACYSRPTGLQLPWPSKPKRPAGRWCRRGRPRPRRRGRARPPRRRRAPALSRLAVSRRRSQGGDGVVEAAAWSLGSYGRRRLQLRARQACAHQHGRWQPSRLHRVQRHRGQRLLPRRRRLLCRRHLLPHLLPNRLPPPPPRPSQPPRPPLCRARLMP